MKKYSIMPHVKYLSFPSVVPVHSVTFAIVPDFYTPAANMKRRSEWRQQEINHEWEKLNDDNMKWMVITGN